MFGVSLKDRAAVLPAGFAGDAAYWIEPTSGAWVTSTYYRDDLPQWVQDFNSTRPAKYWDREWKDGQGTVLRSTAHRKSKDGSEAGFYEVVGSTAFANEYEFEFAKELMQYENVGRGPATDLLSISLSRQRHSWPPGWARFSGDAADGARSRPRTGRFLQFSRTSDRPGQRMDGSFGRSRRLLAARCSEEAAHTGRESRRRKTRGADQQRAQPQNFLPAIRPHT